MKPVSIDPTTGDLVAADATGGGSAVPTLIASGTTFTIPADTQMQFIAPCVVDGIMKIDGLAISATPMFTGSEWL